MHDLLELNEIDRLLMTRYKEHDDEENSRSSRDRRRYTEQIERLEQQLEGLRLEYEVATSELHRLRRNRDSRGWTPSTARRGHAMRWSHHEAHRPSRQDAGRVCSSAYQAGRTPRPALIVTKGLTRVTSHLGGPQLKAGRSLVTTQQELAEARSVTTRAQEAETLKDRQLAALREEQLQKDPDFEAISNHEKLTRDFKCKWRSSGSSCYHPRPPGLFFEQCK